jgi:hypothetical protein
MQKTEYVFELPACTILDLANVLDSGSYWEEVAFAMPGICDVDIDSCRRLKTGERPTGLIYLNYSGWMSDISRRHLFLKRIRIKWIRRGSLRLTPQKKIFFLIFLVFFRSFAAQ